MAAAEPPIALREVEGSSSEPAEMRSRNGVSSADEPFAGDSGPGQEFSSLPPVDGGKDAWLFLAASFMLEALVWGFAFAYGVFQDYYSTHEPFAGSSSIAVVGTCAMGIMYLDIPLVLGLVRLYPRQARWTPVAGLLIMCLSLALSSFSTKVSHLIITQGVFYAIGGSVAYGPSILYMDEWFVKRKGLAYGIMWSGTGLAGFVLPLVLQKLLSAYGFQTALRAWACAAFLLSAPLAWFLKPRLPPSATTHIRPFDLRFALTRTFALHQLANVAEALGFFLPGIYLPSYASAALGASPLLASLTVLLVNVASVFGCVAVGGLVDRLHATTVILACSAGAALGTFLLWGLATSLPVLYVFCVVYGFFAGSFTSTWPGIMRDVVRAGGPRTPCDPCMVFALLAAGRGVGNVASGPLSESLIKGMPWRGGGTGGYGSGYGTLIVFTGVTAVLGGGSFFWRRIGWL